MDHMYVVISMRWANARSASVVGDGGNKTPNVTLTRWSAGELKVSHFNNWSLLRAAAARLFPSLSRVVGAFHSERAVRLHRPRNRQNPLATNPSTTTKLPCNKPPLRQTPPLRYISIPCFMLNCCKQILFVFRPFFISADRVENGVSLWLINLVGLIISVNQSKHTCIRRERIRGG